MVITRRVKTANGVTIEFVLGVDRETACYYMIMRHPYYPEQRRDYSSRITLDVVKKDYRRLIESMSVSV